MADPVSLSSINPLSSINLGTSMGTFGSIALVIGIAVVILALIGGIIYWYYIKKQYWITIEVSRLIGGNPMRVATYSAREIAFGMAGDKLWRVASSGIWKFKTIKWLPVGKLQSAPRVWKYWIREDGEWINYQDANIDDISKTMGIRFVQEDMRLQKLATERLLEQRLMNKTFWEKWQTVIMTVIFFLVIAICMIIIFYQFGKLLDRLSPLVSTIDSGLRLVVKNCGENYLNTTIGGTQGLIPA